MPGVYTGGGEVVIVDPFLKQLPFSEVRGVVHETILCDPPPDFPDFPGCAGIDRAAAIPGNSEFRGCASSDHLSANVSFLLPSDTASNLASRFQASWVKLRRVALVSFLTVRCLLPASSESKTCGIATSRPPPRVNNR